MQRRLPSRGLVVLLAFLGASGDIAGASLPTLDFSREAFAGHGGTKIPKDLCPEYFSRNLMPSQMWRRQDGMEMRA